ncbi:hypothetical protein ACWEQ3_46295 [Streptomyces mirabilis]
MFAARQMSAPWALCSSITQEETAREWLTWASAGVEGVVFKQLNDAYRPSVWGWQKYKVRETSEAIVGAVTGSPATPRTLLLGRHDTDGRLQYVGRTTTPARATGNAVAGLLAPGRRGRGCGRLSAGMSEGVTTWSTEALSLRDRGGAFVVGALVGADCCRDQYAAPGRTVPRRTGSERNRDDQPGRGQRGPAGAGRAGAVPDGHHRADDGRSGASMRAACRCRSDSWPRPLPNLRGKASPDGS